MTPNPAPPEGPIKFQPFKAPSDIADPASRRYHRYEGRNGRVWFVADQPNAADNIYVLDPLPPPGFNNHTLTLTLTDGEVVALQGPWHSNSDALFKDTGVDVRGKCHISGIIAFSRSGDAGEYLYHGVIWLSNAPILMSYDTIEEAAQEWADITGKKIYFEAATTSRSYSGIRTPK